MSTKKPQMLSFYKYLGVIEIKVIIGDVVYLYRLPDNAETRSIEFMGQHFGFREINKLKKYGKCYETVPIDVYKKRVADALKSSLQTQ